MYHQDPPGKPTLDVFTRTYGTISPSVISNGVVVARVGQDIRISCVMKGDKKDNSIPTYVRIKKDGVRLSSPKKFSNQIDIVASESENNAKYECEAENSIGLQTSEMISLDVRCKLQIILFLYIGRNRDSIIHCTYTTNL